MKLGTISRTAYDSVEFDESKGPLLGIPRRFHYGNFTVAREDQVEGDGKLVIIEGLWQTKQVNEGG